MDKNRSSHILSCRRHSGLWTISAHFSVVKNRIICNCLALQVTARLQQYFSTNTPIHPDLVSTVWNGAASFNRFFDVILDVATNPASPDQQRAFTALGFYRDDDSIFRWVFPRVLFQESLSIGKSCEALLTLRVHGGLNDVYAVTSSVMHILMRSKLLYFTLSVRLSKLYQDETVGMLDFVFCGRHGYLIVFSTMSHCSYSSFYIES